MPNEKPRLTLLNAFDPRLLGALGVLSAGLLLAEVNLLASRHYHRVDLSQNSRFSLSEASKQLIGNLKGETHITVLLGSGDPLLAEAKQLLSSYAAISPHLRISYIDPDRDAAQFLALSRKLKLGDEALSEDGIATASFLVERDKRSWFIKKRDLSRVDDEGGVHSRMEAALTEGLARVQQEEESAICFVSGHGERSIDDAAPEGLSELARTLRKSNISPRRVPFDVPAPAAALKDCDAVAVVGPTRPYPKSHEQALLDAWKSGKAMIFFLDPILDEKGGIASTGLVRVARAFGVLLSDAFVLEQDPEKRLPEGLGESFFATAKTHPITSRLSTDQTRLDAKALLTAASPIRKMPGSTSAVILETSASALVIDNLSSPSPEDSFEGQSAPFPLAIAQSDQNGNKRRRALVVGSSNPVFNRSFRDNILQGNQVFTESAFSWLLDRPTLVSVPERTQMSAGLNLSEASLWSLLRYVLLYMPLTAACAGGFVLLRRRRVEDRSRSQKVEDEK